MNRPLWTVITLLVGIGLVATLLSGPAAAHCGDCPMHDDCPMDPGDCPMHDDGQEHDTDGHDHGVDWSIPALLGLVALLGLLFVW